MVVPSTKDTGETAVEFNSNDYQNLLALIDRAPVKGIAEIEATAVLIAKVRAQLLPKPVAVEGEKSAE